MATWANVITCRLKIAAVPLITRPYNSSAVKRSRSEQVQVPVVALSWSGVSLKVANQRRINGTNTCLAVCLPTTILSNSSTVSLPLSTAARLTETWLQYTVVPAAAEFKSAQLSPAHSQRSAVTWTGRQLSSARKPLHQSVVVAVVVVVAGGPKKTVRDNNKLIY